ncbi:kelch repeat-containing protein [Pyxidicoccus sp. QH1ED-7-1]|nr:kelch repeat-containing protein [Pyxidicoccus xibeiensis]
MGGEHYTTGALASVERFDPATGTWASAPALGEPRGKLGAVVLPEGTVLVMGGGNEAAGMLPLGERYVPGGCVPAVCAARDGLCGAVPDGCGGTLDCGPCGDDVCGAGECRAEGAR